MRTIVYVDGLNLYYRMLKARPDAKWLNLIALAKSLLRKNHEIVWVNYYTARISSRAHDPDAPSRQATYLAALGTEPGIVVHEGNFLSSMPWMPLATPPSAKPDGYVWALPAPEVVRVKKNSKRKAVTSIWGRIWCAMPASAISRPQPSSPMIPISLNPSA